LNLQLAVLFAQPIGESPDQVGDPTFLPIDFLAPLLRLAAWREVNDLIGSHAPKRELREGLERAQERARNDPSINDPHVTNALRQPQLRREGADQRRDAPAFDLKQRAA